MLVGLAGVFVPLLPGIELVWLAALGYGILHGFDTGGILSFIVITLVLIAGLSSDIWITGLGMRATGTSLLAVFAGGCLLMVGSLVFTPIIGIILWLSAILLIEYSRKRDIKKALASTGSMAASCTLTYGFKFSMGILMVIVWAVWALQG
jgi:uncharacterized protein YqgC (DUF456 family)